MSKRIVFAEHAGVLYVKSRVVMSDLVALIDGLSVAFFGRGKTMYLKVTDAIEWCKKEREYHSREKYDTMIEVMERALEQERIDSSTSESTP